MKSLNDLGKRNKEICKDFNELVFTEILLKGLKFHMGSNLGTLQIIKKERNPLHPEVDWVKTNKLPKNEKGKPVYLIYFTDKWKPVLRWYKKECSVKNQSAYRMRFVRGNRQTDMSYRMHRHFDVEENAIDFISHRFRQYEKNAEKWKKNRLKRQNSHDL